MYIYTHKRPHILYIYIYIYICVCVKFSHKDLNPDPFSPHPISTYTSRVTTVPRVRSGETTYT